ncbi:hypothetical protein, partial [Nocardia nova]|uniref:hypothetical protein n=1 Tax=Nocardia nova TaxID=37330 RepID=UPI001894B04A
WPADTHPGGAAFVRHSSWWCVPESPENGRAVAALLGYHTSEEALRDLVAAPTRLAYLLNFPTNDLHPLLQVRLHIHQRIRDPLAQMRPVGQLTARPRQPGGHPRT